MRALVIVAHPDDETIFFGGLMLAHPEVDWHVVCVTDGDAAGLGPVRAEELSRACARLGVARVEVLGYPDLFERRLDTESLIGRLSSREAADRIYTHSAHGDYGHPHHQDVSFAAHQAFAGHRDVWSVAYNVCPEASITLDRGQFRTKAEILWDVYRREARQFLGNLPVTATEGFTRVSVAENAAIHDYLVAGLPVDETALDAYRWLMPYLRETRAAATEPELFTL